MTTTDSSQHLPDGRELTRLAALGHLGAVRPEADDALQEIVDDVRSVFRTRLAMLNIVTRTAQYFRAWSGELPPDLAEARQDARERSMCQYVVESAQPLIVEDFLASEQYREQHFCVTYGIRFYAGTPLITSDGHAIGTLCLLDTEPRSFDSSELKTLSAFARAAVSRLELLGALTRERRLAQRASQRTERLRQSEARFRSLVQNASDLIAVLDTTGRVQYLSPAIERVLGYQPEQVLGARALAVVHPGDLPSLRGALREILRTAGISAPIELRARHADGTWRHLEVVANNLLGDPTVRGVIATARDITERKRMEAALRESESRFRAIFEGAGIGITVARVDGQPIESNTALQEMLGYTNEELRELSFHELTHPDDADLDAALYREMLEGGRDHYQVEERYVRKDGRLIWGRLTVPVARDELGAPEFVIGMFEDVTHRRIAEDEARFQAHLLDQVQAAVIVTDMQGKITHWNEHAERMYGWTREEALGRPIVDTTVGPAENELAEEIMSQLRVTGHWQGEFITSRKDGTHFPALVNDSLIRDALGNPVGIVGVSVDVSEQKQLEARLRDQLNFMSAINAGLAEGVYAIDREGRVIFANPAAEQMLGWTEAELIGEHIHDRVHYRRPDGSAYPREECTLLAVARTGVTYRADSDEFIHKNGTPFPVAYASAPIVTEGEVTGAVIAFRDVSDLRRLEHAREEYVSLISHDLRTPLTAIIGHAQLLARLLRQRALEREVRSADAILASSRKMGSMIRDLLDTTQLESGRVELHPERVDLAELLSRVVEHEIAPADRGRIRIHSHSAVEAQVDAERIERVVMNFLTNALKYSEPEASVDICLAIADDQALISVVDEGPGIPEEHQPRLFDKYYRVNGGQTSDGLGLGLYISRLIAEAHGGRVWVESEPGAGSTFHLALPLARDE